MVDHRPEPLQLSYGSSGITRWADVDYHETSVTAIRLLGPANEAGS